MESKRPFAETLRQIMDERGVGVRELGRRCESHGWGSYGTIGFLRRGELQPTMRSMEAVARALEVKPETFAEYRLGKARAMLDPDEVGLKKALSNLAKRK